MDRDPGDFEPQSDGAPSRDGEDARLDAYIASLPPAPGIKSVDDPFDDEDDIGDLDTAIAEGRAFPHAVVRQWLKTWGQPDCKPFEEWLADQNG